MIELKNVTKVYDNSSSPVKVFENFNFALQKNKITCVLGKSGCGKTTLLNILAGTVSFKGEIRGLDNDVSYIFQEPRLLPNLTVAQNLQYVVKNATKDQIYKMLSLAEISDKADVFSGELSGGQAQRVAIARAFLKESELLLMDEPFSSLDTALKIRLTEAFVEMWKRDKRTVLFVTHDIEEAFMLSHRIIVLDDGKIIEDESLEGDIPRKYGANIAQKQRLLQSLLSIT